MLKRTGAYVFPVLAIAIPYSLLDRRIAQQAPNETSAAVEASIPPAPRDFLGSLHQALMPLLGAKALSLEIGAKIAETSPRTLRRWLAEEGTSWREILDRVHFEACEKLMLDPSRTLADIAAELGYSDQPHLTRAFRRWTGEPPATYRHRRMSATEQLAS